MIAEYEGHGRESGIIKGRAVKPRDLRSNDKRILNNWMEAILKNWTDANPLGLNETLLTMKAYAPFHHL